MKPRILNMTVRGFLKINETSLDFAKPVNVLTGPNRAGKSSLASAPEWALTGKARGVETKKGAAGLINDEAKRAEVVLTLDNSITIRRSRTKSEDAVRVVLADNELKAVPGDMEAWAMGVNPNLYFSLEEGKRTRFIFDLFYQNNPNLEGDIADMLEARDIPGAQNRSYAGIAVERGFKAAESQAIDCRRDAKRTLDALNAGQPEEAKMYGQIDLSKVAIDELTDLLSECERKKDKLIEEKGRIGATPSKDKISAEIDRTESLIFTTQKAAIDTEKLETERQNILGSVDLDTTPTSALGDEIGRVKHQLSTFEESAAIDIADLESEQRGINTRRQSVQKSLEAATETKVKAEADLNFKPDFEVVECPKMPITCPVSIEDRQKMWPKFKSKLKKAQEQKEKAEADIQGLQKYLAESQLRLNEVATSIETATKAKKELPRLQERLKGLESQRRLNEIAAIIERASTAKSELSDLRGRLEELKEQLGQASDESIENIQAEIQTLSERINRGRSAVEAKKRYDSAVKELEQKAGKVAKAKEEVELYDKLAKLLGPDGIQKDLVDKALGKFRGRIAETAGIFGDRIDLDDELLPVLNGHAWQFLSGSERWLASAIFQEAIAYLSECPWLIMDGVDVLDRPNRNAFIEFLMTVASNYSTVLAFVTLGDIEARASEDPDVDMWTIENGKATKLVAQEEAA